MSKIEKVVIPTVKNATDNIPKDVECPIKSPLSVINSNKGLNTSSSRSLNISKRSRRISQSKKNEVIDYNKVQTIVKRVKQQGKVFMIDGNGYFPYLADTLEKHGWIQRFSGTQTATLTKNINLCSKYRKRLIYSNLLRNVKVNFVWISANNQLEVDRLEYPFCNRITVIPNYSGFATKIGLTSICNDLHWVNTNGIFYPRSYALKDASEKQAFIEDFRRTCCTSFLHYVISKVAVNRITKPSLLNTIPYKLIRFAIDYIYKDIIHKNNNDLDFSTNSLLVDPKNFTDMAILRNMTSDVEEVVISDCITALGKCIQDINDILEEAVKFFPDIPNDGYHNIWIVKPSGFNCGNGITVLNDENKIMNYMKKKLSNVYIIQKYIERPLLVYNTKFDIRQYFLVHMDGTNLNVWLYNNCYLKFSSQEFTLSNFSREIHVTNHTVQKMFKNGKRSSKLPSHNMWLRYELELYLATLGKGDVWSTKIYPDIANSLLNIINLSLQSLEYKRNNFQLFGADFMVTEDYKPMLLEINSSPDLRASTPSTAVICKAVVEDLVKGNPFLFNIPPFMNTNKYLFSIHKVLLSTSHKTKYGDFELIQSERIQTVVGKNLNMTVFGKGIKYFNPVTGTVPLTGNTSKPVFIYDNFEVLKY